MYSANQSDNQLAKMGTDHRLAGSDPSSPAYEEHQRIILSEDLPCLTDLQKAGLLHLCRTISQYVGEARAAILEELREMRIEQMREISKIQERLNLTEKVVAVQKPLPTKSHPKKGEPIDVNEAARRLNVKGCTVNRLYHKTKLKGFRVEDKIQIWSKSVEDYINENSNDHAPKMAPVAEPLKKPRHVRL